MKPPRDVTGMPYDFNAIPMWIYPDVWDETKQIRLRGLWFVVLDTISFLIFIAIFIFPGALIFDKSLIAAAWVWIFIGIPFGLISGLASWWDFTRLHKKMLLEEARKKLEVQSKETPPRINGGRLD